MLTPRKAYWIISAVLAAGLLASSQLTALQFNFDFENFFEKEDPKWLIYEEHVEQFGNDNDYLLIGIRSNDSLFTPAFLKKLDAATDQLESVEGVTQVLAPTRTQKIIRTSLGTVLIPYLHIEDQERLKQDSSHVLSHPNLANNLLNIEISAAALVVYHQRYLDKSKEDEINKKILDVLEESFPGNYHAAGRIRAQSVFIQLIQDNFSLFIGLSVILIIGVLYLLFRELKWIFIPLIAIALSVIITLSTLALTDQAIDVLSSMLPTILLVTAMSDVVHFLSRYFDLANKNEDKLASIWQTLKEVGAATFLTSFTTAIGFASLLITDSLPVKNLGLYTAIGVMITYAVIFTLLPSVSAVSSAPTSDNNQPKWTSLMGRIFLINLRRYKLILVAYAVTTVLAISSLSLLVVDTPLIADFPRDHEITRDFNFFDQNFGGSKPFEVSVNVISDNHDLLSPEVIKEVDKLSQFLEGYLSNIVSPSDMIKTLNMANHGGRSDEYRLPLPENELRIYRQFPQMAHHFPVQLITEGYKTGRMTGFSRDEGSVAGLAFYQDFEDFVKREINPALLDVHVTGTSYLFDLSTEALVNNILYGLLIAVLVVALIMAVLFRSFKVIVIAVLSNILPLIFLASIMAIVGIPLRLSTSIIFAIAFGIAVDDTIHFLTKFHLELRKKSGFMTALKQTFFTTGKAMIITTVILSLGFIIFICSSFDATFYTGLLISLTLALALIIDLTLLPVLLLVWMKKDHVRHRK